MVFNHLNKKEWGGGVGYFLWGTISKKQIQLGNPNQISSQKSENTKFENSM